jgi:alpha-galactosidase
MYEKLKIAVIGAGSVSFCPCTINDIVLSDKLCSLPLEISLMDIRSEALEPAEAYAVAAAKHLGRDIKVTPTASLEKALDGADFVITAIEVNRLYYWSQDWNILRKYGFRQTFGENGGPGSMFHTLRNLPPILEIAHAMERLCPDAWLLNFTNPEAKLVEAVLRLTRIKAVGLCHGTNMGIEQLADILEMDEDGIDVDACGLNHFGWFQRIEDKKTGKDLYPELKDRERRLNWVTNWGSWALPRIMLRTYGLYPYPGTCHIGEYIAWSDQFDPYMMAQYFYDPANEDPWARKVAPHSEYTFEESGEPMPRYPEPGKTFEEMDFNPAFEFDPNKVEDSGEVAIEAIEAIVFHERRELVSTNMMNRGLIPNLPNDMVIEVSSFADAEGIHGKQMKPLPDAVAAMISQQGTIHKLVIEAYTEQSRNKLLQAILLDPTVSTYYNAVSAINEMCELQREILPPMKW